MRPIVIGTLMEFYSTGQPVLLDDKDVPSDTTILETDSEVLLYSSHHSILYKLHSYVLSLLR